MNCHSFENILDLHREGRLSPRRAKAAARHLDSCPECRALAEPAPAAAPSARAPLSLKDKLLAAVKEGPSASAAKAPAGDLPPLWPRETRGIALAAAALLVVGLIVAISGEPSQSDGGRAAAAEAP